MLCQFRHTGENEPKVNFRERARKEHTSNQDLDSSVNLLTVPCRDSASAQGTFTLSLRYMANLLFPVPQRGRAYPTQRRDEPNNCSATHVLAALLLYIAPTKLGLVQAVGTDTAVLWNLAARTLPTAPGAPALLHRRLLLGLVSGNRLNWLDRWSQRFSLFGASYR